VQLTTLISEDKVKERNKKIFFWAKMPLMSTPVGWRGVFYFEEMIVQVEEDVITDLVYRAPEQAKFLIICL
jgi:hypothetical protein